MPQKGLFLPLDYKKFRGRYHHRGCLGCTEAAKISSGDKDLHSHCCLKKYACNGGGIKNRDTLEPKQVQN